MNHIGKSAVLLALAALHLVALGCDAPPADVATSAAAETSSTIARIHASPMPTENSMPGSPTTRPSSSRSLAS
jgi:hypothetical protein